MTAPSRSNAGDQTFTLWSKWAFPVAIMPAALAVAAVRAYVTPPPSFPVPSRLTRRTYLSDQR